MPRSGLEAAVTLPGRQGVDLLALGGRLNGLAAIDPGKRRIVELRSFGGLRREETSRPSGNFSGLSEATSGLREGLVSQMNQQR